MSAKLGHTEVSVSLSQSWNGFQKDFPSRSSKLKFHSVTISALGQWHTYFGMSQFYWQLYWFTLLISVVYCYSISDQNCKCLKWDGLLKLNSSIYICLYLFTYHFCNGYTKNIEGFQPFRKIVGLKPAKLITRHSPIESIEVVFTLCCKTRRINFFPVL